MPPNVTVFIERYSVYVVFVFTFWAPITKNSWHFALYFPTFTPQLISTAAVYLA